MTENPIKVNVNIPGGAIDKATADLMLKAFGGSAEEAGGLVGDVIGVLRDQVSAFRFNNRRRIANRTRARLIEQGISTEDALPLPNREIGPVLEGISDVDQPALSDLWSGLIASALNPNTNLTADRSFTGTINLLSEVDALVFTLLINSKKMLSLVEEYAPKTSPSIQSFDDRWHEKTATVSNEGRKKLFDRIQPACLYFNNALDQISPEQLSASLDNLIRLGVVTYGPDKATASRLAAFSTSISRERPEHIIGRILEELQKPGKLRDRWKEYPIERATGRLPKFNIHATDWGERLAAACMIELPKEIQDTIVT
ncbi:DUF4393 domain-containing protein [Paracoccus stylophorae]|uniref:DUF4393 domain-containing protein n=1 Tax=Paracoccus stylophorae TaxID=659350 RepID=A0ABY7SRC9_9RHOB|nr:Abi-alpha family protein [Paracoccus stylophorae]WCR09584.1 DUF4393 domain-containing protein [Paracoccus stylophorae]